jgi:hypothetical protein
VKRRDNPRAAGANLAALESYGAVEPTLAALIGLVGGLALGRTPLGSSGHALLERAIGGGASYLRRDRLMRSPIGWAIACVGLAAGAGLVGALLLWAAAIASSSTLIAVAPMSATALVIAVATGSRGLWPLRDDTGPDVGPALGHWLTLLFFYGLLGPAGMLGMESLLVASCAGEPEVGSGATRGLLAVLTYLPRRVADMIAAGLSSTDASPAARTWWRGAAGVLWGVALAAGLATVFHLSGQHPEAYFKNWEDLAYPHRIAELSRSWHHGVIYPRIFPTFAWGYGYPYPNFYPPAVFFAAAALHQAGLSIAHSINVVIWLIIFAAALGVYLFANGLAGPIFATLAAVLASAARAGVPTVIYADGALAQALGLAWIPFVLLGVRYCYSRPGPTSALLFGLAVATQALIHNISAVLTAGLVALYLVVRGLRHPGAKWALAGGAMGLGLAAFFWLPALAEKNYVLSERLYQWWLLPWWSLIQLEPWWRALSHLGLGSAQSQVPFAGRSLYLLHTQAPPILWALAFVLLVGGYRHADGAGRAFRDELFLWLALALVSYFAMAESAWAWRMASPLRLVQAPKRIVPVVAVIGPMLAAVGARELWWRLRSGRTLELGLACAWFAIYLAAAMIAYHSKLPTLLGRVLLGAGPPLAVVVFAYAVRRLPKAGVAAVALVALVGIFVLLAARDRRHVLEGFYRPIPAPDRALTEQAYLCWEQTMKVQVVGTNVGEYLPRWTAGRKPSACPPRALVGCEVLGGRQAWLGGTFAVRVPQPARCLYGAFFYPGWKVLCDGRAVMAEPSPEGLLRFTAPAGTTAVEIRFGETRLRKAADGLSLACAVLLVGLGIAAPASRRSGTQRRRKGQTAA